jgi:hypothetical protein
MWLPAYTLADLSRGNEATVNIEEEVELLKMREDNEVDVSSYWMICRKREYNRNSKRRLWSCSLENSFWTRLHTCHKTYKATMILSLHTIFELVFRNRKWQRPSCPFAQFRIIFNYISLQLDSRNKKYWYVFSKRSSNVLIIHQLSKQIFQL